MQSNTFRLFISSTFSDFKKEREILHTKVFPRISEYCTSLGFSFQPIDLRWGVNNEAQLDQKTLEVCLEEVKACKHFPHPHFLIMCGDRYGYIPLPYMIETEEFERLKKDIAKNNESIDIIYKPQKDKDENIISHKETRQTTSLELLDEWYKEDKNQIPLEDENQIPLKEKNSTAYILQPRRRDEYAKGDPKRNEYTIYVNWEAEQSALRKILQTAATATLDIDTPEWKKYFLSATEAEVIEGIREYGPQTTAQKELGNTMDKEYVFGYLRTIDNPSGAYADQEESLEPTRAETFKKNLENTLRENIHQASYESTKEYESSNFEAFEKYFYEHLKLVIDKQKEQTDSLTSLQKEQDQQKKFKNDKLKGFLGREKTLSHITTYLNNQSIKQPLIIYGPSGMGKSSLLAKAIEKVIKKAEQSLSNAHILYRFVGATQGSTTLRALLTSICDELQEK
ncbi:MAG: DUF4062 domain-containing protein, partial [Campylobacteraceae bacterium]|nr:DUF4062 domain-containing protein [Campylobacteraceae bacterium]